MRAALANGAVSVVWVTLRETTGNYHWINRQIEVAPRRWQQLVVADWNASSRGKAWFGSDGLHLDAAGATALAGFLRPYVLRAAGS
jgi:lysophospholipase L1-like esterase